MSYKYLYGYTYLTTNTINGKKYVGQKQGKFDPNYLGSGVYLKDAIKHYGKENFSVVVLEYAKDREHLNLLERQEIEKRNAVIDETYYNLSTGGDAWGSPRSAETRAKFRVNNARESNPNWKGGLCSDDPKEYDRQRHKRNYVPVTDGPGKGSNWRNKSPEHIKNMIKSRRSYKGDANPNSKVSREARRKKQEEDANK
tara:strand:+ start:117 stop:710 length:594 start_codon:yes stop_codon:yes gene_type:complete